MIPVVPRRHRRRAARRDAQVADLASLIARAAHSGATLSIALEDAATTLHRPLRDEVRLVLWRTQRGTRLHDALALWQRDVASPAVDLFAVAARLGHLEGGVLAVAMDGVAAALVDDAEVRAEAHALAAQARASALVLVALPPFGLGVFAVVDPSLVGTVVGSTAGQLCLTLGVLLDAVGGLVALRIVNGAVG